MTDLEDQLYRLQQHPHCQNCGQTDPAFIKYGDDTQDGFTACCNENICRSQKQHTFGDGKYSVKACCWAHAEILFRQQGVDLARLNSMKRTSTEEE